MALALTKMKKVLNIPFAISYSVIKFYDGLLLRTIPLGIDRYDSIPFFSKYLPELRSEDELTEMNKILEPSTEASIFVTNIGLYDYWAPSVIEGNLKWTSKILGYGSKQTLSI